MKIRNGFVSNSSSSSFAIVGSHIELNDETVTSLAKKFGIKDAEKKEPWDLWYDVMEEFRKDLEPYGLELTADSCEDQSAYIGVAPKITATEQKRVGNLIKKYLKGNTSVDGSMISKKVDFHYGEYNY